jgi:hypothetical protein
MDCVHDEHEDMHFTGADDEELTRRIKEHRDQYNTAISDEQIRELVGSSAHDE